MSATEAKKAQPRIVQWLLDTRPLWPVPRKDRPKDEVQELKVVAARALALLSESEQQAVLKYYHAKDAKMSLASHLLKHLVVTKYCNVPWSKSKLSREPKHGKPIYVPEREATDHVRIDFNVSHQAGIVSLIAAIGFQGQVDVGTDVVCANERLKQDYANIEKEGFFAWVDMHGDVFAPSEVNHMKLSPVSIRELGIPHGEIHGYSKDPLARCQWRNGKLNVRVVNEDDSSDESVQVSSNVVIDAKIRRFYAMWCLRESYVKMTGEALLASWLRDLDISEVQAPAAKEGVQDPNSLEAGEVVQYPKIFMKEKPVRDVDITLSALGAAYMVGGAVRAANAAERASTAMGKWLELNLEADVLDVAESKS
ncbi:4'-phosphopantetheinyl transferase NpgA [Lachnellula suecica]|uniref:holo-[acyl-carrier-protein] synthase n=1 Tax=Lachnellula suecica TaxID=602035 RepID=A0A8T9CJL8_9HELO|nr:4'-phosphopantetheinyl transferase NpgA [Lachnellula suecica]